MVRMMYEVLDVLKKVGFEIFEEEDLVKIVDILWYELIDLYRRWSSFRDFWLFKTTSWGRNIMYYFVFVFEKVGIVFKGSVNVSMFLKKGVDVFVVGGKMGIYTVMYFIVARKSEVLKKFKKFFFCKVLSVVV